MTHTSFFFPLILRNYILSRTIFVLFIATMPIARRGKCLLGQPDSSVCRIKDVSFLELLIYSSLCSIFLKMKIAKKQRMWEMYVWTLLQPGMQADRWSPLNYWEHLLTLPWLTVSERGQEPVLSKSTSLSPSPALQLLQLVIVVFVKPKQHRAQLWFQPSQMMKLKHGARTQIWVTVLMHIF